MDPSRFSGFSPTVSWNEHKRDIDSGRDLVGFRFIEDNHHSTSTAPSKLKARQLYFPSLHDHPFGGDIYPSLENIEKMTGQNTRNYLLAENRDDKRGMQKYRTVQTEIIGEFVALRRMTEMRDAKPMFPIEPGHGKGVDQMWDRGGDTYVVEAKGPGATLSRGQMTPKWIKSRLDSQSRSQNPERKRAAKTGLKHYNTKRVKAAVITAIQKPDRFKASAKFTHL